MSNRLKQLNRNVPYCTFMADLADGYLTHHAYAVLDEKCLTGGVAYLQSLPGILASTRLFEGTPYYFISDTEPLLLKVQINSRAWQSAMQLCLSQAGWVCKSSSGTSFEAVADHLRTLFLLDDSVGGKAFVRLQQPHVWSTLLTHAEPELLQSWLEPLGRVFIPDGRGGWFRWEVPKEVKASVNPWRLTPEIETALQATSG